MNFNAVKTTPAESSAWSNKQSKKPKKKKRRNKHRLYSLRLKKHKRKSSASKPSVKPPLEFSSRKIMSNWYWSNYKKAVEWRDKHELAHWKACALALQEENRYLLGIINQMRPGMRPDVSMTWEDLHARSRPNFKASSSNHSVNAEAHDDDDDDDDEEEEEEEEVSDEEYEFEMSEEMIQFFQESMKHKENLKKLKEQESAKRADEEVKQLQMNRLRRTAEMQQLYGEGASMITGMETAVQLSYDRFCETKSPKYWPNIPFRL